MTSPRQRRIGIYGGRFDPPHIAHLIHARLVCESFALDRMLFVPAANPPHKSAHASFEHRAEMTELAIKDEEGFLLSLVEKDCQLSYTADTIETIHNDYPEELIFLILGRDEYDNFTEWHEPQRIKEIAELIVLPRNGKTKGEKTPGVHFPDLPILDISSSMIRNRLLEGKSVRHLVPEKVEAYIIKHNLYMEVL